jgi:hypothetical protein
MTMNYEDAYRQLALKLRHPLRFWILRFFGWL